jgi:deazaflavin-dependent oxidoreductase (nitroreductase family)
MNGDAGGPIHSFWRRRYRAVVRPTVKVLARLHLRLLRAGRGTIGNGLCGGRVVLLTTVGRRSGRERTTPLAYMRHGDSLVVAASCAGSDRLPDWWLNLQCQPRATIEMSGVKRPVHAHQAGYQTMRQLTPDFVATFPRMHFYQRMSRREIPLIVLEPSL